MNVIGMPPLGVSIPGLGWDGTLQLSIIASQVSLIFTGEDDVTDLATLRNAAQNLAQDVADVLCYSLGHAYSVEITSATTPSNEHVVFPVTHPAVADSRAERPLDLDHRLFAIVFGNPALRRALGDLRRAIRETLDTGFHCQRAIECLRHHFQGGAGGKAAAWERMRECLNVTEETLKTVNRFGDSQRHGAPLGAEMSAADRDEAILLAWRVVDRFVAYLDGGEAEVDRQRFPEL